MSRGLRGQWWLPYGSILPRTRRRRARLPRTATAVRASLAAALAAATPSMRVGGSDKSETNVVVRTLSELDARIANLESELGQLGEDDESDGDTRPPPAPARRAAAAPTDADRRLSCTDRVRRTAGSEAPAAEADAPSGGGSLRCEVCGVSVTSDTLMREHIQGKKHLMTARLQEAKSGGRHCAVCDIVFTSVAQLAEHKKGRKHREAETKGGSGLGVETAARPQPAAGSLW